MIDPSTVSTVLTSIKTAVDIASLLKESGTSLEHAEMKLKLADLISSLADAKMEIATIYATLQDKENQITDLEKRLQLSAQVEWHNPSYWTIIDNEQDGPFCQKCYDSDEKLIRLQGDDEGYWICNACKNSYLDSAGKEKFRAPIRRQYAPYKPR